MKNFFRNVFGNKGLVTVVAFGLCVVIIIFAYNYRIKQKINPIDVPYAKEEIPSRTLITKDMVGTISMPASMVTGDIIRRKDEVIDKYVNFNTKIPKGSMFYRSVLVDWSAMPDAAWSNIKEGNTIVSLSVSATSTFGNSIYPGDKIDLYYKSTDQTGKLIYGKLIEGIEVLAVKDDGGNHIFKKTPDQAQAVALIFSVSEDLHLLLRKAMYLDGEIIPVPRNAKYSDDPIVSSEYLRGFILNQTFEVPLDEVKSNKVETDVKTEETKNKTEEAKNKTNETKVNNNTNKEEKKDNNSGIQLP